MYNEEQKLKFISQYTKSKGVETLCLSLFNATEPFESKWNADLCTKDSESLQAMVDNVLGFKAPSRNARLTVLRQYVMWCIDNVNGSCDGMLKIKSTGLEKVRRQTVSNPVELQKYLDDTLSPESDHTVDNLLRAFCWLVFSGLYMEDTVKVKCTDVDFRNMVIHYDGREYPIYKEALPSIRDCCELTQFAYFHPGYAKPAQKDRAVGVELLRSLSTASPPLEYFSSTLSKYRRMALRAKKIDTELSGMRIQASGLFYRMYETERAGGKVDFSEAAEIFMQHRDAEYTSDEASRRRRKTECIRQYKLDYHRWKKCRET